MVLAFVRHTCGNPTRCQVRACHLCGAKICDQVYTDQWCSCDECWKAHQAATEPRHAHPQPD